MVHENNFKYLKAPTMEQIEATIKDAGVSEYQFERFHRIYKGCIKKVRFGYDVLPVKHWHLFLEPSSELVRNPVRLKQKPISKQRTKTKATGTLSDLLS